MRSRLLAATLALAALAEASAATSVILVDNFHAEGTDAAAELVHPSSFFATAFTTGTSPAIIQTVAVKFYNGDSTAHNLVAHLYSDAGGLPGGLLASSAQASVPNGALSEGVFDFGAVGIDSLSTYWLVYHLVEATSAEAVYGPFTSEDTEVSDYGWTIGWDSAYSLNGGASWTLDTTDLSHLRISGVLGTIPEPASFTAIAGFVAGAATLRRRRRAF